MALNTAHENAAHAEPTDCTLAHWQAQTQARRAATLYRQTRVTDNQADSARIFSSNDYLGLATHPALAQALALGAQRYGVGSTGSHLISGHSAAHEALDAALADWFAPHIADCAALSFSTGYMANLALLTALADACTTVFSDRLNHASLIDGMQLAKAQKRCTVTRYAHTDMHDLAAQLEACTSRHKLIVTDGVFSMDGDIAPLPALLQLAAQHAAWVVVDDAHGVGPLGARGAGCVEYFGLQKAQRLIVMGTLGKAVGCAGAFVAAPQAVVEWLVQAARPYIFTTAASPAMAHAVCASVQLIQGEEGARRREQLNLLIASLKTGVQSWLQRSGKLAAGWYLMPSETAILPLVVGDNALALALAEALRMQGFFVSGIRPPTVPEGSARLRLTLSATHTLEDVSALLDALEQAAARL